MTVIPTEEEEEEEDIIPTTAAELARWEWWIKDMIRYYPATDTFTCLHYDFDHYCQQCQIQIIEIELSIFNAKCAKANIKNIQKR